MSSDVYAEPASVERTEGDAQGWNIDIGAV